MTHTHPTHDPVTTVENGDLLLVQIGGTVRAMEVTDQDETTVTGLEVDLSTGERLNRRVGSSSVWVNREQITGTMTEATG